MFPKDHTCATCLALHMTPGPDKTMGYLCKRHPPTISVLYAPRVVPTGGNGGKGEAMTVIQTTVNAFWPSMNPKDPTHGCMDWIRDGQAS